MKKAYYLYFIASILFMVSGIIRLMNDEGKLKGILLLVASVALLVSGIASMKKSRE